MYISIFSTVVCRVIIIYFWGLMNLGVIGIALAMVGDWAIKSALILVRYLQGQWKILKSSNYLDYLFLNKLIIFHFYLCYN
ncbi:MAG: hypothetical protein ACLRQF_00765 [Thomasclavelia ramosa]